ncbi:hypothetical protein JTT07_04605 [Clostridium botulinum]|nr:hypothetical protein [Clostridium botulinum]
MERCKNDGPIKELPGLFATATGEQMELGMEDVQQDVILTII